MTGKRKACVLVVVLASGLALATSTRPVMVDSMASKATPGEEPPVGVLFASSSGAGHHAAHAVATTGCSTCKPPGETEGPAKFFDRK